MFYRCPTCGMAFVLSQEVSRHVRTNSCQFQNPSNASIRWNCSQCLFTTDSQAECFFHEVLHSDPFSEVQEVSGQLKVILKYACPICQKSFRKASLRHHLRQHTFERPYACSICGANFTRQSSLANHSKSEHGTDVLTEKLVKTEEATRASTPREFTCEKCKKELGSK